MTCGGVGLSDRTVESVSLETRVLDIEAVADSVGADQFALFCTMASGPAAITYAHRHPDRVPHLILWNSYARAKDFFFGVERNVALGAVLQSDWERFTEISQGVAFGWGRDEGREYGHFFRSSVTAEMCAKYGAGDVRSDVTDQLPEITVPTLVLLSEDMQHVTVEMARELASGIPGAVLQTTPGAFLDNLDTVDRVIADFLRSTPVEPGIEPTTTPAPAGGGALYAGAMALALIYLGEHYAVDVLAGIAVALAAWFASERLIERVNARSTTEEG